MKLNLGSLKQAGTFTGRPVEEGVTWRRGNKEITAAVYIRPMGYHGTVSNVLSTVGRIDGVTGRIAASICDESDAPVFTVADITGEADPERDALGGTFTAALLVAIQQVNNLGETNPAQMTNSSVNQFSTGSTVTPLLRRKDALALPNIATESFAIENTEALTE